MDEAQSLCAHAENAALNARVQKNSSKGAVHL
jgi:hypothetical protein